MGIMSPLPTTTTNATTSQGRNPIQPASAIRIPRGDDEPDDSILIKIANLLTSIKHELIGLSRKETANQTPASSQNFTPSTIPVGNPFQHLSHLNGDFRHIPPFVQPGSTPQRNSPPVSVPSILQPPVSYDYTRPQMGPVGSFISQPYPMEPLQSAPSPRFSSLLRSTGSPNPPQVPVPPILRPPVSYDYSRPQVGPVCGFISQPYPMEHPQSAPYTMEPPLFAPSTSVYPPIFSPW